MKRIINKSPETVNIQKSDDGFAVLHLAVVRGRQQLVRFILNAVRSINSKSIKSAIFTKSCWKDVKKQSKTHDSL